MASKKADNKSPKMLKLLADTWVRSDIGVVFDDTFIDFPIELHWHNFFELEIIVEGSGYQLLNGKRFELKKGTVYLMRLTDFHQVFPDPAIRCYSIKIDENKLLKSILNEFSQTNEILSFELNQQDLETVKKLFEVGIKENESPNPDIRFIKHLINCLLIKTLKRPEAATSPQTSAIKAPLQEAMLYLHMHFRENPSLAQVAKIAHYNPSHFSSTFHKSLGFSYSEYLNLLKISYAKEILLSTDLRIKDVCFECGFTSTSNFLRIFKQNVGISPLKFRKLGNTDKT